MDAARRTFGKKRPETQFHAATRGQHRVGDDKRLILNVGSGQVLYMNAHLVVRLILIFTISRHEGVGRMVKHVEESLVKRQTGTEDSGQHHLIYRHPHIGHS